jgi:hypothetical protein
MIAAQSQKGMKNNIAKAERKIHFNSLMKEETKKIQ